MKGVKRENNLLKDEIRGPLNHVYGVRVQRRINGIFHSVHFIPPVSPHMFTPSAVHGRTL